VQQPVPYYWLQACELPTQCCGNENKEKCRENGQLLIHHSPRQQQCSMRQMKAIARWLLLQFKVQKYTSTEACSNGLVYV
jgi:hypothetical protein